jgi:4'-phosphopantetheinyl transferase
MCTAKLFQYNKRMTWSPAPPQPDLLPGQAHVYRLALELPPERLESLLAWLDEEEQARAARYHFESDRRKFVAAHGQVRQALAVCLGVRPAALRFTFNDYGKPALASATELRFNLAHSGSLGLLAVCAGQELGVDLEMEGRVVDIAAIARRFYAPGELAQLLALPEGQQRQAFFACWTRKEAYLKGRGLGLSLPLDSFEVSLAPGEPPQLFDLMPGRVPNPDWRLYDLRPAPGYAGALAVQGNPVEVVCWDWVGG